MPQGVGNLNQFWSAKSRVLAKELTGFSLRFVIGGNKFAIAGGYHLVNVSQGLIKAWQSLKSALFLMKENAQTKSDFFTGDGFSM